MTIGCFNGPETCGDGTRQGLERCDTDDLGGYTCVDYGFTGGTLGCTAECVPDLSQCTGDMCQANGWYSDGWCDPCELYGGTPDPDCDTVCTTSDGTCGSYPDTLTGTSTCLWSQGTEDPDCGTCGDGTASEAEWCDGTDLGYYTSCADFGYSGGTLACRSDCAYDTSSCTL
jgi:hypothetical protein